MKPSFILKYLLIKLLTLLPWVLYAQHPVPTCGTNDSLNASYLEKISKRVDLTRARAGAGEMLEYRIAVDVEYKTASMYGFDQVKIRKAVYKLFADASAIFERETNIRLTVTYIHIWQEKEPYEFENDLDYLTKVYEYWNKNLHEERDALVGLSTRSGWFYGGNRIATANFPAPGATIYPDLLAHELGHTLGSAHTHSCMWPGGPIDRCADVEGAPEMCPGENNEFLNGTIMSYCRSKLTFHPMCRNVMREYAEGKVNSQFSLNPLSETPAAPPFVTVLNNTGDMAGFTPAFEWYPPKRSLRYRVQIATNEAFTDIVEDTVVNQPFFQSPGLSDGNYFVRYQAENSLGTSDWSANVRFKAEGWSQTSATPPLLNVVRTSEGVYTGSFKNLQGISSYQLQLSVSYSQERYEVTGEAGNQPVQHFSVQFPVQKNSYYTLHFRVKKQGIWSDWLTSPTIDLPPFTTPISPDTTRPMSTQPIFAVKEWVPLMTTDAFAGELEISTDPSFKNLAYQQAFSSNGAGDWHTDKTVFTPELNEHTTYFLRSRMVLPGLPPSGWAPLKFTTGRTDKRFRFLGIPSNVTQVTGYSTMLVPHNRLLKAGDNLYVFHRVGGYHHTTDLQTWKSYLPSTTQGYSPRDVVAFGAAPNGQTLTVDPMKNIAWLRNKDFVSPNRSPVNSISWNDLETMVYSEKDGYFFKNLGEGVIQIKNSMWIFHRYSIPMGRVQCLAKDNQERVWVMGEWGSVWRYENDQWNSQPHFPLWEQANGMMFDDKNNGYAYGNFGVFKLDAGSGEWVAIEPLSGFTAKKMAFDNQGAMWLASYRGQQWDNSKLDNYALVKYANGKTNVYSDGLNFLREQFDIEYFKDQLVIMTPGGEIHAFDERQILSFVPETTYCAGQQVNLGLATNSSFSPENKTSVQLREAASGKTTSWEVAQGNAYQFTTLLPDSLPQGQYSLAVHTTAPEITSYSSAEFTLLPSSACDEAKGMILLQNKPNPLGASGSISFYLPQSETVQLELFNLTGQKIGDLATGNFLQGWHSVDVSGVSLVSGVYVYRLKAGKNTKSLRMVRN